MMTVTEYEVFMEEFLKAQEKSGKNFGCLPTPPDAYQEFREKYREFEARPIIYGTPPPSYDLSSQLLAKIKPFNQYQYHDVGTCTAAKIARYIKPWFAIQNGYYDSLMLNPNSPSLQDGYSTAFTYKLCKNIDGIPGTSGTYLTAAINASYNYGFLREILDPYSNLATDINLPMPSSTLLQQTERPILSSFARRSYYTQILYWGGIGDDVSWRSTAGIAAIQNAIANNQLVFCSRAFFNTDTDGVDNVMPMPTSSSTWWSLDTVVLVGYRTTETGVQFKCWNSFPFGTTTDANYMFWLPENYIIAQLTYSGAMRFVLAEAWTLMDYLQTIPLLPKREDNRHTFFGLTELTRNIILVPTITGVVPNTGSTAGGTSVTINGTGFDGVTAVKFGDIDALSFTVNSLARITAVTPPANAGTVDITVVTQKGTTPVGFLNQFTYGVPVWTSRTSGAITSLSDVTWDGSQFVVVGASGKILTSPDGITWTSRVSGTSAYLAGIAWSGSQFVAVGGVNSFTGVVLTSPDGITWTLNTDESFYNLWGITWSGSQFVAVEYLGAILTSSNGITWTSHATETIDNLYNITWNGSQFVAVGASGTILTSPDGITWTSRTSGTTNILNNVAWIGSQFVAVGDQGTILTSPDGITWTLQNSGITSSLFGIVFGEQLTVVGTDGTILTSPDGITWTSQTSGITDTLRGIAWNGYRYVAVGDSGKILTCY